MSIGMIEENLEAWPLDVNECFKNYGWIEKYSNPNKMVVSYLFPSHFVLDSLHVDFQLYGENYVSPLCESGS